MANILLIESATEVCGAAISRDGEVIAISELPESQSHASVLTLQIDDCLQQSGLTMRDLDAVALSHGPGSYTSLRVGASVAKGICYALDIPLIAVDTLQALAWASREKMADTNTDAPVYFMPMIDARRQEVWTAVYDRDLKQVAPPQPLVIENDLFEKFLEATLDDEKKYVLISGGNGCFKIKNVTFAEDAAVTKCSARHLNMLSFNHFKNNDYQNIIYYSPFYMKPPAITTPNKIL